MSDLVSEFFEAKKAVDKANRKLNIAKDRLYNAKRMISNEHQSHEIVKSKGVSYRVWKTYGGDISLEELPND